MLVTRRQTLGLLEGALALALMPGSALAQQEAERDLLGPSQPFPEDYVISAARALAAKPFAEITVDLPPELADLTYSQYREIVFNPDHAIWRGDPAGFYFELFHTGFFYKNPVDVFIVDDGEQRRVNYRPELFIFGPKVKAPTGDRDLHFSGIRLCYPLDRPGNPQEFAVFQGASYFRAVAKGQIYGLSARGLAVNTAQPQGEEFPLFRAFWVRKATPEARSIVVHALLDSPSCTGAYRFTLRPGEETQMDVELMLFPRVDLDHVGFAPLTSMFLYDDKNRSQFDDFRLAVHDNDGLAMQTGAGEWLWRPLNNPKTLQISAFMDNGPRGFGLMQRKRAYRDFLDLEARYERRPSLWVEPVGDWGAGHVELVEIPSDREYHDNIVAYWQPKDIVAKGTEFPLTYRLHWCQTWPVAQPKFAQAQFSGAGLNFDQNRRLFIIEFSGGNLSGDLEAEVSATVGKVVNAVPTYNPETGGYRLGFELEPGDATSVELRARLTRNGAPVTETWLYRWTA
ncbi:MAG TPA: glucan biosynthesis protein G [Aestuariivirgaceae bacterium]|nr:glucan biosynthesis protein G [Aestuariivirgaceae bacterium]